MNHFQQDKEAVLKFVSKNCPDHSIYNQTNSAFRQLTEFLADNQLEYSPSNGELWLHKVTGCRQTKNNYSRALRQLQDIYVSGEISLRNQFHCTLPAHFESLIKSYVKAVTENYTEKHLENIDCRCRFFLKYLYLKKGLKDIGELTYADIFDFYDTDLQTLCHASISMYKAVIMKFLVWLSAHTGCSIGFSLIFFQNYRDKVLDLKDFQDEEMDTYISTSTDSESYTADIFYRFADGFISTLQQERYHTTMLYTSRTTLNLLFLFLDINGIDYSPKTSAKWFQCTKNVFGTNEKMARRVLALFSDYCQKKIFVPRKKFSCHGHKLNQFPDWCRIPMQNFLELKAREGKAESSITMYRSSIMRFCLFLCSSGIADFSHVTAELMKQFNLSDKHQTADGKNAYNVRIRKFLFYLAEHNYLNNYSVANALSCVSAPKVRIVKILTDDEETKLNEYSDDNDNSLQLRNRAIIQLGLKMGLRSSDIVSLKLNQIDWRNQSVRFIQRKTDVEKILPMPVSVGNALYLYLMHGRPSSNSSYIFISHKAPYDRIGRSVCYRIMEKSFPIISERPGGFHITRRTYATKRFRNDCSFTQVADLLGHTTNDSVHKYISLDEERMRLCPIPLSVAGIPFKGGFGNE